MFAYYASKLEVKPIMNFLLQWPNAWQNSLSTELYPCLNTDSNLRRKTTTKDSSNISSSSRNKNIYRQMSFQQVCRNGMTKTHTQKYTQSRSVSIAIFRQRWTFDYEHRNNHTLTWDNCWRISIFGTGQKRFFLLTKHVHFTLCVCCWCVVRKRDICVSLQVGCVKF